MAYYVTDDDHYAIYTWGPFATVTNARTFAYKRLIINIKDTPVSKWMDVLISNQKIGKAKWVVSFSDRYGPVIKNLETDRIYSLSPDGRTSLITKKTPVKDWHPFGL